MIPATTTNWQFLLTRLLRGATVTRSVRCTDPLCFYSHASCEARPSFYFVGKHRPVSTHTPLARRDDHRKRHPGREKKFLLTRLLRGATRASVTSSVYSFVSTHTPLARRDTATNLHRPAEAFLLTRLLRGATARLLREREAEYVSTHTPLARRDTGGNLPCGYTTRFLLTRLLRGATKGCFK